MLTDKKTKIAAAWIVLVAICIGAIFFAVIKQDQINAPLSPRYTDYAIPVSISKLRGLSDYTAYMELASLFIHHKQRPIAESISLSLLAGITQPTYRWFISGDDKGLVSLVYLSFCLFGSSVASIYILMAILAVASVTLYVAEFFRSSQRMALLVATLLGFYAILFTFGLSSQSTSIIEPRFIGFLGVVALLHIVLIVLDGAPISLWSAIRATMQTILLVFVVHMRSSEMWQIVCIFTACMIAVLISRRYWRVAIGTIAVVVSAVTAASVYRHHTYHHEYLASDLEGRVLWHNVVMGLSANDRIRRDFKIRPFDDVSITEAVKTYLSRTNQTETLELLFANPTYANGNFSGFKWSAYEPKARDLLFQIIRTRPREVVKTYVIEMPKIFVANLALMGGFEVFRNSLWFTGELDQADIRNQKGLYLNPVAPFPMIILVLMIFQLARNENSLDIRAAVAGPFVIAWSIVPPALAMPVLQYIQLSVMLMLSASYFLVGILVSSGLKRLARKNAALPAEGRITQL